MKIKSITAKNYRTLENVTIPFSDNYVAISGMNNAGKSCIITLLSNLLHYNDRRPWSFNEYSLEYKSDITQWVAPDGAEIQISYEIALSKCDDASLITFLAKLSDNISEEKTQSLKIFSKATGDSVEHKIIFNDYEIKGSLANDVLQKLKTSNLMFLHNSINYEDVYYGRGGRLALVEFVLSENERKQIIDAESSVQNKIKKFAKQHKDEIQEILGKMHEKYSVDFTTIDSSYSRHIPLSVRLQDGQVDAPLNAWGSGTQNKTYILLSLLWASRIKTQGRDKEKITPIVVIEEPESFLHPTAQAEFGKLLSGLADDLGVQIIVTTHSPYMLNRNRPKSNILLKRPLRYNKMQGSEIIVSDGDDWMLPFSEHLGVPATEFESWLPLFSYGEKKILLVEGQIDVEYFDFIQKNNLLKKPLPSDIQVVAYGGKDALKNTVLLKFTLEKYDSAYITFDLDALTHVERSIEAIGYVKDKTYFAIGKDKNGHKDIEGLLPDRVRAKVYAENTETVTSAIGGDKSAKDLLKKKLLEEFKLSTDYTPDEMKHFQELINKINKGIKANKSSN